MTDLQFLVLLIVLIYLSETCVWVRRGSVVVRGMGRGKCTLSHPSLSIGNDSGGLVFLNPLPPLGISCLAHQWPISLSREGMLSYVSLVVSPGRRPGQVGRFVSFDAAKDIEPRERDVWIGGELFATLPDEASARHWAAQLRRMRSLSPERREAAIERMLKQSTDLEAINARVDRFNRIAGPLRLATHLLFAMLLLALPAALTVGALRPYLLSTALATALYLLVVIVAFFFSHRALYPRARGRRWRHVLVMCFTPTAAIRATDLLSRELLVDFHPLAVAAVLCREAEFRAYARRTLLDAQHPVEPACPVDDPAAHAVELAFRQAALKSLGEIVTRAGIDRDALLAPPAASDPQCQAYCPRCDAQYVVPQGQCTDCGGLELVPIPKPDAVATKKPADAVVTNATEPQPTPAP